MFDEKTGFFYDLQINEDGSKTKLLVNRGKGTEGWLDRKSVVQGKSVDLGGRRIIKKKKKKKGGRAMNRL